jgi:putative membrane protein
MNLILYFFVMAAAMLGLSHFLPGFHVTGWGPAIIAAIILALLNVLLRPILWLLSLPFILLTLGLFLFIINAIVLWITAAFVPGFRIDGLLPALLASLILSLVSMLWKSVTKEAKA